MPRRRRPFLLLSVAALSALISSCADPGRKINTAAQPSYPATSAADRSAPLPDNVKEVVGPPDTAAPVNPRMSSANTPATHASDELALAAAVAPEKPDETSTFTGPERGDGWLTLRIRSLLLVRSNVSAANTHVSVHDGIVTLTGVAESVAQKRLTEEYARGVEGVRGVKNELTVANGAPSEADNSTPSGSALEAKLD